MNVPYPGFQFSEPLLVVRKGRTVNGVASFTMSCSTRESSSVPLPIESESEYVPGDSRWSERLRRHSSKDGGDGSVPVEIKVLNTEEADKSDTVTPKRASDRVVVVRSETVNLSGSSSRKPPGWSGIGWTLRSLAPTPCCGCSRGLLSTEVLKFVVVASK